MNNRAAWTIIIIITLAIGTVGCSSDEEKKIAHFEKGKIYFDKGEFKSAELEYRNAIQIDPQYVEAYERLGETYLRLGDPRSAFREYTMVAKMDPENINARLKLATFNMLSKNLDESHKMVEAVLEKEPENIEALFLMAGLNEYERKLAKAATVYKEILILDDKQVRAYLGLSRIYAHQELYDEAEAQLKHAVGLDPKAAQPRLELARFYADKKSIENARLQIEKAIEMNPENAELYFVYGSFFRQNNKIDEAEAAYLKAVEIKPNEIRPYMIAAEFYESSGAINKTVEMYQKALSIHPDDVNALTSFAGFFLRRQQIEDAERYLSQALDKRPNFSPARLIKGEIAILRKDFSQAIDITEQLTKEEPRSFQAHYLEGVAHLGKGERHLAKTSFARALELNPNHVKAKTLMAEIALRDHDFDEANKLCNEILALNSKEYQARMILGDALMAQGNADAAAQEFKMLIAEEPDNPIGYFRLGLVQRMTKDDESALNNFKTALSLNPMLMEAFSNIIGVYHAHGKVESAIAACDDHLQRVGDSAERRAFIQNLKGEVLLANKNIQMAEDSFKTAIEENPEFLPPYYSLAKIYHSGKQPEKAIGRYQVILEKDPKQVQSHMLLGILYDAQNQFDLSEKHYRAALGIDQHFAPAANNLAYLLSNQDKNIDEALIFAQIAKEKLPGDPNVMDTLGWIYYKKGLYGNAVQEFSDSLEKLPDNATIHFHLGAALLKKGDKVRARQVLEKALALSGEFDGAGEAQRMLSEI